MKLLTWKGSGLSHDGTVKKTRQIRQQLTFSAGEINWPSQLWANTVGAIFLERYTSPPPLPESVLIQMGVSETRHLFDMHFLSVPTSKVFI